MLIYISASVQKWRQQESVRKAAGSGEEQDATQSWPILARRLGKVDVRKCMSKRNLNTVENIRCEPFIHAGADAQRRTKDIYLGKTQLHLFVSFHSFSSRLTLCIQILSGAAEAADAVDAIVAPV